MTRFRYLRDRLFLMAVVSYAANRWLLKPHVTSPFWRGYFNDLLLIPAALPVLLWLQRISGLRKHDNPPGWTEFFMHLVVWSVICEFVGPHWLHRGTADGWDIVAYTVGGVAACVWWNRPQRQPSAA